MARRGSSTLNALLAVDKPVGCTSHDVVGRVRRLLGERRVGHAGTLDPLASGVMVVGVGQATRLLGLLTQDTKSYLADIAFGYETNTDDAEGEPTRFADNDQRLYDERFARTTLAAFVGVQQQVPPAFSAISVNGVRAYRAAREGNVLELPPRTIEVFAADLIAVSKVENTCVWTVAFTVSKGTYIRALARDVGRRVGGAAHISSLRRTASGSVGLSSCLCLDDLSPETACAHMLDPVRALGCAAIEVSSSYLDDICCGRRLPVHLSSHATAQVNEGDVVALTHAGVLLSRARVEGAVLVPCDVYPQGIGGVRC